MSKNMKCPVCQKGTIMFKENLSCECSQCRFQCHHGQIERIAAAMELARELTALSKCDLNNEHREIEKRVEKAERRVLEVFGGE